MIQANGLRAILFDLDGTLRYNQPRYFDIFFEAAIRLGMVNDPEKRRQALRWQHRYWAQSPELRADLDAFDGDDPAFWNNYTRLFLLAFGCLPLQAPALSLEVDQILEREYRPQGWVSPQVGPMLAELRRAGFTLAIVSNRTKSYTQEIEELGLGEHFDLLLAAGEINQWKPEPGIFQHALGRLRIKSEQAMYVGDNYYADILGARQAGLRTVLIDADGLFPEADCPVISAVEELPAVLMHP